MVWASGSFGLKFKCFIFLCEFFEKCFQMDHFIDRMGYCIFFCIRVLLNHKVVKNKNRVSGSVFRKKARRNDAIPTKLLSVDYHNPKTLSFKFGNDK